MKTVKILVTLMFLFAATSSTAAGLEKFYLYPMVEYFTWEEFDTNGSRLLKESGPLFGVGASGHVDMLDKFLFLRGKAELFGGQVDYDGQTTDIDPSLNGLPTKTDANYYGARLETDLGWRLQGPYGSLMPYAGIGYRLWIRDLQGTSTLDRSGATIAVSGVTERWHSLYTRLGMRGELEASPDLTLFAEGGAKYPFYNSNSTDLAGIGEVTVEPGSTWSWFAEVGAQYRIFRPSFYYEGYRFSRSPGAVVFDSSIGRNVVITQPKSESDIFGVKLGVMFW